MGHVEDRWFKTIEGPDGKERRVKTDRHGLGMRYRARYDGPDGRERSKSFPDRQKRAAEDFLTTVESDKLRGSYIDPAAGLKPFDAFAEAWLRTHQFDESSRETVEFRVRKHVIPFFGKRPIASIKPGLVREWNSSLVGVLAANTRSATFTNLSAILTAAVDDRLIGKNPCAAKSVTQPRAAQRKVVPWPIETVTAVRAGLLPRYRPMVDIGAGCGARQGEIFGLSPDDFDFAGGWLHIRRQVKRVRNQLVFGLPKNDKERRTPLADSVAQVVRDHLDTVPALRITLPWEDPCGGEPVTVPLVFTNAGGNAVQRHTFNVHHWHKALISAGIEPSREDGMHALRHFFASVMLDAGETIKAIAEWLGHSDPGFTLRTYTHLMPSSQGRARRAVDGLFGGPNGSDSPDGPDGPQTAQEGE